VPPGMPKYNRGFRARTIEAVNMARVPASIKARDEKKAIGMKTGCRIE